MDVPALTEMSLWDSDYTVFLNKMVKVNSTVAVNTVILYDY